MNKTIRMAAAVAVALSMAAAAAPGVFAEAHDQGVADGSRTPGGLAMRRPWYRRAIVTPASIAIGCIAAYWMVERTGLL